MRQDTFATHAPVPFGTRTRKSTSTVHQAVFEVLVSAASDEECLIANAVRRRDPAPSRDPAVAVCYHGTAQLTYTSCLFVPCNSFTGPAPWCDRRLCAFSYFNCQLAIGSRSVRWCRSSVRSRDKFKVWSSQKHSQDSGRPSRVVACGERLRMINAVSWQASPGGGFVVSQQ